MIDELIDNLPDHGEQEIELPAEAFEDFDVPDPRGRPVKLKLIRGGLQDAPGATIDAEHD